MAYFSYQSPGTVLVARQPFIETAQCLSRGKSTSDIIVIPILKYHLT